MSSLTTRIVVLLSLATLAAGLPAQDDTVFREMIDVRLVEIEVVVTGADGEPVGGLTRDDFEIRQGRKRLLVTHFTAVEDGQRRRATDSVEETVETPLTAADRLYLVVYIDQAYLAPGELGDVVRAMRGFLHHSLRMRDRVMLVKANYSLEVVRPFTTLSGLVDEDLGKLEPEPSRSRAMAEFPRILQEIERVAQRGTDIPSLSRDEHPMMLKTQIESFAGETHQELLRTTHQLHRLIPTLAGLPGCKEIVYIGGTLPTNAATRLHSAWLTAFGPSSKYQQQRSSFSEESDFGRLVNAAPEAAAGEAGTNELFRKVATDANAHGVTLHVLDTGGLRRSASFIGSRGNTITEKTGAVVGGRVDVSRRLGNPQILKMMAENTGGRALVNSRTFEAALDDVASDLRNYYVLAFEPQGDGEMQDVRVKLKGKRGKLDVRYRQAYRSRSADGIAADKAVSALLLGEAEDPLGIELAAGTAQPIEGKKGFVRLPLSVFFPVGKLALVEDRQGHRGQLSIYLTAGDFERGASQVQKAVVPLRFTREELANVLERRIEYKLELPMAAGSRKVAVALRDDFQPLTATVVLELSR